MRIANIMYGEDLAADESSDGTEESQPEEQIDRSDAAHTIGVAHSMEAPPSMEAANSSIDSNQSLPLPASRQPRLINGATTSLNGATVNGVAPIGGAAAIGVPAVVKPRRRRRVVQWFDTYKDRKTPTLLRQIWKSDWTIAAFIPMGICFYAMKLTGWPWLGVLFFMLAMSTVDAILSIFVVRLSFQQNKSGFYRTEDYERDWLRYRVLLSMTKAALLFVIGLGCGWTAMVGAHITWFFTSCERLRYIILRWSMSDKYPDLQRWSIFAILREIHVQPTLRNFDIAAGFGLVLGFGVTVLFR